jgi:hypothetical protein
MRTQPLEKWGNGRIFNVTDNGHRKDYLILNWDGTPRYVSHCLANRCYDAQTALAHFLCAGIILPCSPVVHQFDRHRPLSEYFFKVKGGKYYRDWLARHPQFKANE